MKCICGSTDETTDDSLGDTICTSCGRVKEGRQIVSNVSVYNHS